MSSDRMVAFLRAINVGGHTVKMDQLRREFERLGLAHVQTVIASGNVIFTAPGTDRRGLEQQIERHLHSVLGYEVATFVRTGPELAEVAQRQPFGVDGAVDAYMQYVGFLHHPPSAETIERVWALRSPVDEVAVIGREVHWLCRIRSSDSVLSGGVFEKTLRAPATFRNINTVVKLAALTATHQGLPPGAPKAKKPKGDVS